MLSNKKSATNDTNGLNISQRKKKQDCMEQLPYMGGLCELHVRPGV